MLSRFGLFGRNKLRVLPQILHNVQTFPQSIGYDIQKESNAYDELNCISAYVENGYVTISDNNSSYNLHPRWIRERCSSPQMRNQQTREGLVEPHNIDNLLSVSTAEITNDYHLKVHFSDGHETKLDLKKTRDEIDDFTAVGIQVQNTKLPKKELWTSLFSMDEYNYEDVMNSARIRSKTAESFLKHGTVLITNGPTTDENVIPFANKFSWVRTTNYGHTWIVCNKPNNGGENIAYSPIPLPPHVDNPYRDPIPSVQLLHCIKNSCVDGTEYDENSEINGDNIAVDGFYVAEKLRQTDEKLFDILTRVPLRWEYAGDSGRNHFVNFAPLIELENDVLARQPDRGTTIKSVRWSTKTGGYCPVFDDIEEANLFYKAKTKFSEMLNDPQNHVTFQLKPGEFWMFDNRRMLHARKAFDPNIRERVFDGCYLEYDGIVTTYLTEKNV